MREFPNIFCGCGIITVFQVTTPFQHQYLLSLFTKFFNSPPAANTGTNDDYIVSVLLAGFTKDVGRIAGHCLLVLLKIQLKSYVRGLMFDVKCAMLGACLPVGMYDVRSTHNGRLV